MKRTILVVLLVFGLVVASFATLGVAAELSVQKEKLTVEQKVKIMVKELQLTSAEQIQMTKIMNDMQKAKGLIKAAKISDKAKATKVEEIKEIQKKNIKKLLGKERYEKYKELKKKDVI